MKATKRIDSESKKVNTNMMAVDKAELEDSVLDTALACRKGEGGINPYKMNKIHSICDCISELR
jgi:hypothetical protein